MWFCIEKRTPWWLLLYKIESPFVNEMSCNLQLYVISSAVECYIKIYSNVAYISIYALDPKTRTPQTLQSSFVQACFYISQGYFMSTTIARSV